MLQLRTKPLKGLHPRYNVISIRTRTSRKKFGQRRLLYVIKCLLKDLAVQQFLCITRVVSGSLRFGHFFFPAGLGFGFILAMFVWVFSVAAVVVA